MSSQQLLLLHGALGSKTQFDLLRPHLTSLQNIHAFDFAGHGETPPSTEPFSIPLFAKNTIEFMDNTNIERADFFGYSMGGYVALYLARHYPERINRMMTLATKFQWDPSTAKSEAARLDPNIIEKKIPAFAKQLAERHSIHDWKAVVRQTAAMMLALGDNPALTLNDFNLIQQGVLVSVGDRDAMVTLEETSWAYRALPNAQLLVLPDTPHPFDRVKMEGLSIEIRRFFCF